MSLLLAFLALAFLIVVHESGHYFVARWCRMRVDRFSIGFGPAVLKHTSKKTGTVFQLAALPFGGFVEIQGMNIVEEVDPEDQFAYPNRPVWQRFLTILAGPATNYLSAMVLAFLLYSCHGMNGERVHVSDVMAGYDAVGKILPEDHIVALDHVALTTPITADMVSAKHGDPVLLTVLRMSTDKDADGNLIEKSIDISVTPKLDTYENGTPKRDDKRNLVYRLGVYQMPDLVQVGVGTAFKGALVYPVDQTRFILNMFASLITGEQAADPAGPTRIVSEFRKAFDNGFVSGIQLIMALSVYLGLFNVLPFPALDGGRLAFLLFEMVTRRRANAKVEATVHMAGIMLLGVVLILVTIRDVHGFF